MRKPNHNLTMPPGHISLEPELGKFYQDFTGAFEHFEQRYFGDFDRNGIPMYGFGKDAYYNQIFIIQYGLISHDFIIDGEDIESNTRKLKSCVAWMEKKEEDYGDTIIWRNDFPNKRYGLKPGWISGMYQGQAMSLYLRYGQMFGEETKYIEKAKRVYDFFEVDYRDGGVKRFDSRNNLWFEEYPSEKPSFVLNGYIYALLGIYDLWRVTGEAEIKTKIDQCIQTLQDSLHLYDSGYWSIYDQLKKELATRYYHKNIHIPLMDIMHKLSGEEVFLKYKQRWQTQFDSKFNKTFMNVMYRLKPRIDNLLRST